MGCCGGGEDKVSRGERNGHLIQINSDDSKDECHGSHEGHPNYEENQQRVPYLRAMAKCVVILAGVKQSVAPNMESSGWRLQLRSVGHHESVAAP